MIPLKWAVVVVAVTVGTLLSPVVSEVPSNCDWMTPSESGCIQSAECKAAGDAIYVFEDCEIGQELFTINDATVSFDGDCPYASGTKTVTLTEKLDAEDLRVKTCPIVGRSYLFFIPVNINEFPPEPTKGTVIFTEVSVAENLKSFTAPPIYYKDDDFGETINLSCEQISGDEDLFSLTPVDDNDEDIKTFSFTVNDELDYENLVFYKVQYNIISTDEKGNTLSATQTFFVYVEDMPDNPPFFTSIVPIYDLEECKEEDFLFQVTAQDRDVGVMYDIKYSMTEDGGSSYFDINENTGEVSRINNIDREELLENGISGFLLAITAKEYKPDGTPGETPNEAMQATFVVIQDCNDNIPEFNSASYAIEMLELTQDSGDQELNLEITVSDMDKGANGSYTLTTSDPDHLSIDPESGKQSQEVTLTARWISSKDNYFNYEIHRDTPLQFTITATEDANTKHTSTVTVTITLTDVNDCSPVFDQPSYTANVKETSPAGFSLLTVVATDVDISEEFGTPSIRYSLGSSCYYKLNINSVSGEVTLNTELNYEDGDTEIHCTVYARDHLGNNGNMASSEIIITVIDEVDEPPVMEHEITNMGVEENSAGKVLGHINVIDLDNDADIEFSIVSHECTGEISTQESIDGWFVVVADIPNQQYYPALVIVASSPDYETCNEVTLTIMAVDINTVAGTDNVNGTVVITITDVNEKLAEFAGDYDYSHPRTRRV